MTLREAFTRVGNALLYKVGMRMPYSKWRIRAMRSLGHTVGSDVYFPADLTLTQNFVYDRGHLTLGDRVSIGPNVTIILASHSNYSSTSSLARRKDSSVLIGNDVWIGAGAIILNGIEIGEGAIVGAGSVVTRHVAAHTTVAGNPARVITPPSTPHATQCPGTE